jgi:hypothetical protein
MKRTKPIARKTKQKPVKDVRWDLQFFIRFLRKTGEGSLKAKFNLPEREALQRAVQRLTNQHNQRTSVTDSLIGILERCDIPEHTREVALHNLWSALASAYTIGSKGTVSKNTKAFLTAAGRRERAEKRAPADQRIWEAITEAAKRCPLPPRRRGRLTWIDGEAAHKLKMKVTTVTSHRKKMLIV